MLTPSGYITTSKNMEGTFYPHAILYPWGKTLTIFFGETDKKQFKCSVKILVH